MLEQDRKWWELEVLWGGFHARCKMQAREPLVPRELDGKSSPYKYGFNLIYTPPMEPDKEYESLKKFRLGNNS